MLACSTHTVYLMLMVSNVAMPWTSLHLAALPSGVDDITAVVIILLEGNPKDKSWAAAAKLMNNVDKFLERLKGFKAVIDQGLVSCNITVCTPSDSIQCHIAVQQSAYVCIRHYT
jgi:hypothetical protein